MARQIKVSHFLVARLTFRNEWEQHQFLRLVKNPISTLKRVKTFNILAADVAKLKSSSSHVSIVIHLTPSLSFRVDNGGATFLFFFSFCCLLYYALSWVSIVVAVVLWLALYTCPFFLSWMGVGESGRCGS